MFMFVNTYMKIYVHVTLIIKEWKAINLKVGKGSTMALWGKNGGEKLM